MSTDSLPAGGLISRRSEDIARVLMSLHKTKHSVRSIVGKNGLMFASRLVFVDLPNRCIGLAPSSNEQANAALLARPRASFVTEAGGWHIEFAAAEPRFAMLGEQVIINLDFPAVIVSQDHRRAEPRLSLTNPVTFECLADDNGVASFDGRLIDISNRGIGFLLYHSDITLEPGTVLKGCHIKREGHPPVIVDLEVRYSTSVDLPDGRVAHRSGCVFLNPTLTVSELIAEFN